MDRFCVICRNRVDHWISVEHKYPMSEFLKGVQCIGGDLKNCLCPRCSSVDRIRHIFIYLNQLKLLPLFKSARILHVAPEPMLQLIIRHQGPSEYILGDLAPKRNGIVRMDIQNTNCPSGSFDWVICNHVLEHVADPHEAIKEVHRILKVGGLFLCQTPFAMKLEATFCSEFLESPQDRMYFYGQDNHRRMFGRDIFKQIEGAGFLNRCAFHAEVLSSFSGERFGVNQEEPLFLFEKM